MSDFVGLELLELSKSQVFSITEKVTLVSSLESLSRLENGAVMKR